MKRHIPLFRVTLPARAQFPIDDKLVSRQQAKARELGPNSIKPLTQPKESATA